MAGKRVPFGAQPKAQPTVDDWVEKRDVPAPPEAAPVPEAPPVEVKETQEKMKRLTLDIPESLHRKIKGRAVMEGTTMVEMLRSLLEQTFE